jgi:carbamoyl-phosphate synthase large subunit
MEHIEWAGVHSGDSACSIPSRTISKAHLQEIREYTDRIAKELKVIGLINVQFAICEGKVYILEANPRASRTVPIVAKVMGVPLANIATQLMLGKKIKDFPGLKSITVPFFGVKEAVFPFNMFPEVDPLLGPEMRATGEVMGVGDNFGTAFYKAQEATGSKLPTCGHVLLTVASEDKRFFLPVARRLEGMGFSILSTTGTCDFLTQNGVKSEHINKIHEGNPNIADAIKNNRISLIINTPTGRGALHDDSFIRMMAIQRKIPYVTSLAAAQATVEGIDAARQGLSAPRSLQEYHRGRI